MTNAKKTLITILGVGILFVLVFSVLDMPKVSASTTLGTTQVSLDTTASPSPSPSPSPTVVPPASAATIKWAKSQLRFAQKEWRNWNHARACFKYAHVGFYTKSPRCPAKSESESKWLSVGKKWRHDGGHYRHKFQTLRYKMVHPGGTSSGVRWIPLMRYVGFPDGIISTFTYIIMRESSGRERALNTSSGAAGLCQFMPSAYHGQWGYPAFNPFDPEQNLRAALWFWHKAGLSPWAP